jgi:CheY-like chemotaxis protein
MMPGIGGVGLIRSLRIIHPDIKVIATSGLEQVDNRSEFAALGVTDFLSKPCSPANLIKVVSQTLAS